MSDYRFDMSRRDICLRLDGIIEAIRDGRNKEASERDAMAWQAALAVAANPEMAGLGADGVVRAGFALTDAFLAERKRQAQEVEK